MLVTKINPDVLRAALRRNGIWIVNKRGMATEFYHRGCITVKQLQLNPPQDPTAYLGANNV